NRASLTLLLLRAEPKYPDAHYEAALAKAGGKGLAASEDRLLFKLGPMEGQTASTAKAESSAAKNN
ncbi:MAG TPA: hypothetical protein VN761_00505, partial [Candidatus Polarisedimenticolia bacterium]|nr:hypothetical protein [Candidatus Polarisedimenticolia bacterium]